MPNLGPPELIAILVAILVLFGSRRLGEAGKSLGTAVREFRKTSDEAHDALAEVTEPVRMSTPSDELPAKVETPPVTITPTEQSGGINVTDANVKVSGHMVGGDLTMLTLINAQDPDYLSAVEIKQAIIARTCGHIVNVFISSALTEEMREARMMARDGVNALQLAQAWTGKDAPASSVEEQQASLEALRRCRIYLLLIGQEVDETVKAEYQFAQDLKKPTLVFVHRGIERTEATEAFLSGITPPKELFDTPTDLRQQVIEAVGAEIIERFDTYGVSRPQALGLLMFLREQYTDLLPPPATEPEIHVESPREAEPAREEPTRRVPIQHEMLPIPAGWFIMGSNDGDEAEKPQHRVYLPAYRISKYPVTNEQFARFVQRTGHKTQAERAGSEYTWRQPHGNPVRRAGQRATLRSSAAQDKGSHIHDKLDHPVVNVSWHDALAYARAVGMRLPTEAEWEKAARGPSTGSGQTRRYPWGDEFDERKCNAESRIGDTTPVGKYPAGASPYGVMDMAGNVWEWCSSLYKPYPYNALDGREDPHAEGPRVLRGGSWLFIQRNARSAYRLDYGTSNFYLDVGLRVVVAPG